MKTAFFQKLCMHPSRWSEFMSFLDVLLKEMGLLVFVNNPLKQL